MSCLRSWARQRLANSALSTRWYQPDAGDAQIRGLLEIATALRDVAIRSNG